jgi:hypothetical protein
VANNWGILKYSYFKQFKKRRRSIKGMIENIKQLLKEYKSTKESLESGLKWLPKNEYAKSKIDVINMVISDLEKLEKQIG